MNDPLILFIFGAILFILGLLLLKRDTKLFEDSVVALAKVVSYYDYRATHNNITMHTMVVEYKLSDGTTIQAREQSGSNRKKYPVGTELDIYYSIKQPELFIVCGDNSRKYIFYGMIIVGLALMILFGYMLLN